MSTFRRFGTAVLCLATVAAWAGLAFATLSECVWKCREIPACYDDDIDGICEDCVIGTLTKNPCLDLDHINYNPDEETYHIADRTGNKEKATNLVKCYVKEFCGGTYYPDTRCNTVFGYGWCAGDDPAVGCYECALTGQKQIIYYDEDVCFTCTEH